MSIEQCKTGLSVGIYFKCDFFLTLSVKKRKKRNHTAQGKNSPPQTFELILIYFRTISTMKDKISELTQKPL